jgi:hypothetical protein
VIVKGSPLTLPRKACIYRVNHHPWPLGSPECTWTEEALAEKLGVILQTVNTWISDISSFYLKKALG